LHFHRSYENQEERREWQNPETILKDIGLKACSILVDVGCGDGFFAIPAARLVGPKGRIYCVDANGEAIGILRKKAAKAGLENLTLRIGRAEETVFCEACADFVFFGIVLHDFNDVNKVLTNARTMLRSSGRLVDLDWKKEPMPFGPPLRIRLSEKEASDTIEKAMFQIESTEAIGHYNYLIVGRPTTQSVVPQY
jgi:ubiquinone/menaquinone biosynthesis C-methylase UbiE